MICPVFAKTDIMTIKMTGQHAHYAILSAPHVMVILMNNAIPANKD